MRLPFLSQVEMLFTTLLKIEENLNFSVIFKTTTNAYQIWQMRLPLTTGMSSLSQVEMLFTTLNMLKIEVNVNFSVIFKQWQIFIRFGKYVCL